MARQQRVIGAILRVPLGAGASAFALTLREADFAFFDSRQLGDEPPADLPAHSVLFRVAVNKSAWVSGRWPRVGRVALPASLLEPQPKFMQDALNPERFELYMGGSVRPATRAECAGLERAAVWEPEHVEDRLRDHYAGRQNAWVHQLQPK